MNESVARIRRFSRRLRLSSLLRASLWIAVLQAVAKFQTVVVLAVAVRVLSLPMFGAFASIQAIGLLFASLWDGGTTSLIIRESAMRSEQPRLLVRGAYRLRAWLAPLIFLGAWLVTWVEHLDREIGAFAAVLILLSSGVAALHTVLNAALVGRSSFAAAVRISTIARVVSTLVVVVPVFANWSRIDSARWIAATLAMAEVLILAQQIIAFRAIARHGDTRRPYSAREVARLTRPYFANAMFTFAYNRLDQLLVIGLAGVTAAGQYAPGSQLQNLLALLASLAASGLIPVARDYRDQPDVLQALRGKTKALIKAGLILSLVACPLIILEMRPILHVIVGTPDGEMVRAAQILVGVLPFLMVQIPISQALIAAGRIVVTSRAYAFGLAGSLIAHVLLDREFGATGGAVASLVRDPIVVGVVVFAYVQLLRSAPEGGIAADKVDGQGNAALPACEEL